MIYVEAPDPEMTWPILFIAGGITGCADWQNELINLLDERELPLIVVNPRRENFPMGDQYEGEKQIKWEHKMLAKADIISFWFPKDTLCPITLFELGKWLHTEPLIGTEYGYQRAMDVRVQTQLELGHDYPIYKSLDDLAKAIALKARWGG